MHHGVTFPLLLTVMAAVFTCGRLHGAEQEDEVNRVYLLAYRDSVARAIILEPQVAQQGTNKYKLMQELDDWLMQQNHKLYTCSNKPILLAWLVGRAMTQIEAGVSNEEVQTQFEVTVAALADDVDYQLSVVESLFMATQHAVKHPHALTTPVVIMPGVTRVIPPSAAPGEGLATVTDPAAAAAPIPTAAEVYEGSKRTVRQRHPDAMVNGTRLNEEIRAYSIFLERTGHPIMYNPSRPLLIAEYVAGHLAAGGAGFQHLQAGLQPAEPPVDPVVARVRSRSSRRSSSDFAEQKALWEKRYLRAQQIQLSEQRAFQQWLEENRNRFR